jgi:hypothetical protein
VTFKKAISLFTTEAFVTSRYTNEELYIGEIYSNVCKLFSGLADYREGLADLEQYYKQVLVELDKVYDSLFYHEEW